MPAVPRSFPAPPRRTPRPRSFVACCGQRQGATVQSTPPARPRKTSQAVAPGIPLAEQPVRPDFLAIKLPKPSQPPPSTPVQVPYVPDFWNSARPKANPPVQLEPPKLHVVSGSSTHYDGGPTYNLEKPREDDLSSATVRPDEPHASSDSGFWAHFWQSLGLPKSFNPLRTLSQAGNAAQTGKDEFRSRSRPLTVEERKGLYVLLGIIGGSWLASGLVNRPTVVPQHVRQLS